MKNAACLLCLNVLSPGIREICGSNVLVFALLTPNPCFYGGGAGN